MSTQIVYKYVGLSEIIADKARSFIWSAQLLLTPATLPCKKPLKPHLFLCVLMRVSQILVVI